MACSKVFFYMAPNGCLGYVVFGDDILPRLSVGLTSPRHFFLRNPFFRCFNRFCVQNKYPEKLGKLPRKLGRLPRKLGTLPRKLGRLPRKLGRLPRKLGKVTPKVGGDLSIGRICLSWVVPSLDKEKRRIYYCWWKKSCTTWDVKKPCKQWDELPCQLAQDFFHQQFVP